MTIRKVWPAILFVIVVRNVEARDIWAESRLADNKIGFYHEASTANGSATVTTIANEFTFNRMGAKVEIKSSSQYTEDADSRLLSIHSVMTSSAQSTVMGVTVGPHVLTVRTSTGGKTYDRTVTFEGEILGPEAARRLTVSRLKSPGDAVSYQMFFPDLSAVATVHDELAGSDRITVDGTDRKALKLRQTMSAMPGASTLWLDDTGWLLRQVMPSPFGEIETTAISASAHIAEPAGAELPRESFAGTLVHSNVQLPQERRIEQVKIRIHHQQPDLGWPDFTAENQTVIDQTRDTVVLEVRRVSPQSRAVLPLASRDFLTPNALLQSDDAEVRAIAAQIAGDDRDVYSVARKLRRWTNENMKFDLGIAIVPASEVVRNRRGTCFGYAVLLASLARAAGVPSRFRMGFAYTHGVWGGHAWVEVLVGKQWIPLDAALYAPGAADAARFSFYTSGLEEGAVTGVGALAKLYGHVDIDILEYTLDGKRTRVE